MPQQPCPFCHHHHRRQTAEVLPLPCALCDATPDASSAKDYSANQSPAPQAVYTDMNAPTMQTPAAQVLLLTRECTAPHEVAQAFQTYNSHGRSDIFCVLAPYIVHVICGVAWQVVPFLMHADLGIGNLVRTLEHGDVSLTFTPEAAGEEQLQVQLFYTARKPHALSLRHGTVQPPAVSVPLPEEHAEEGEGRITIAGQVLCHKDVRLCDLLNLRELYTVETSRSPRRVAPKAYRRRKLMPQRLDSGIRPYNTPEPLTPRTHPRQRLVMGDLGRSGLLHVDYTPLLPDGLGHRAPLNVVGA